MTETHAHEGRLRPAPIAKNLLTNGNLEIWQNGTSFSFDAAGVAEGYTADRWYALVNTGTMDVDQEAGVGNFQYGSSSLKIGAGDGYVDVVLSGPVTTSMMGEQVTASIDVKCDSATSVELWVYSNGAWAQLDTAAYASAAWSRLVVSGVIPALAEVEAGTNHCLKLRINADASDPVYVDGAMVVTGLFAELPFVPLNTADDWNRAKYFTSGDGAGTLISDGFYRDLLIESPQWGVRFLNTSKGADGFIWDLYLQGVDVGVNTDANGVVYIKRLYSAPNYKIEVYSDSARTQLVASSAFSAGDGADPVTHVVNVENASGLSGHYYGKQNGAGSWIADAPDVEVISSHWYATGVTQDWFYDFQLWPVLKTRYTDTSNEMTFAMVNNGSGVWKVTMSGGTAAAHHWTRDLDELSPDFRVFTRYHKQNDSAVYIFRRGSWGMTRKPDNGELDFTFVLGFDVRPETHVLVRSGIVADSTNSDFIEVTNIIPVSILDTGVGGLDDGGLVPSDNPVTKVYALYLLKHKSTDVVSACFSERFTSPISAITDNYKYRRVGSVIWDVNYGLRTFTQKGNEIQHRGPIEQPLASYMMSVGGPGAPSSATANQAYYVKNLANKNFGTWYRMNLVDKIPETAMSVRLMSSISGDDVFISIANAPGFSEYGTVTNTGAWAEWHGMLLESSGNITCWEANAHGDTPARSQGSQVITQWLDFLGTDKSAYIVHQIMALDYLGDVYVGFGSSFDHSITSVYVTGWRDQI